MLTATIVTSSNELEQILRLQQENLVTSIDEDERRSQGFLTVQHTMEMLQQMHSLAPGILVKEGNELAGYALMMPTQCRTLVPKLEPMFASFDRLQWQGKPLHAYRYYVMGQICVSKKFRGQGVFDLLYQKHKEVYQPQFDFIITEVATRNTRSMRAHERVGFKTIDIYRDDLDEWAVVLWDWC